MRLNLEEHLRVRKLSDSEREVIKQFESFGGNCELGLVQRKLGLERLRLFRYAGSQSPDDLISGIVQNFDGLASDDNLEMRVFYDTCEVKSSRYGYQVHTFIDVEKLDEAAARRAESQKLAFMAGLLVEHFDTAHKISSGEVRLTLK